VRERKELQTIVSTVEADVREQEAEAKQEFDTEKEDVKSKNDDDINMLKATLDQVITDLEAQFDEAHAQYMENTEKKTKEFKALTERDKEYSEEIDRQVRQIDRLQTLLTYWRKKMSQNERECGERNKLMKSEKEAVLRHYHELKERMTRSRDQQTKRLTELALWARQAHTANVDRLHRAERILTLTELGRKLESSQERMLPFVPSLLQADLVDAESTVPAGALGAELAAQMAAEDLQAADFTELDRFFRKYNRALLGKLSIDQEKGRLEKENADLRSILKQYLDGITVNSDAVDGPNSLLVINGRVNLNQRPVRRMQKDPVVVEATTVVHSYAAHAAQRY
jgi:hypothetical protein